MRSRGPVHEMPSLPTCAGARPAEAGPLCKAFGNSAAALDALIAVFSALRHVPGRHKPKLRRRCWYGRCLHSRTGPPAGGRGNAPFRAQATACRKADGAAVGRSVPHAANPSRAQRRSRRVSSEGCARWVFGGVTSRTRLMNEARPAHKCTELPLEEEARQVNLRHRRHLMAGEQSARMQLGPRGAVARRVVARGRHRAGCPGRGGGRWGIGRVGVTARARGGGAGRLCGGMACMRGIRGCGGGYDMCAQEQGTRLLVSRRPVRRRGAR